MVSIMRRRVAAASILLLGVALAGCGGRQGLEPADDGGRADGSPSAAVGPVDLTYAPRQLPLSCDHGVGPLAFFNPCEVGSNLSGQGGVGFHETECRFFGAGEPVAWSFVLPLSTIEQHPERPLSFPADFPTTPSAIPVQVGVQQAKVTKAEGTVTFSRVDPTTRAFIGWFKGTISWAGSSTPTFSCAVDAPLWGAPGSFE